MNKLWTMLYGNLMNESGSDGGAGGSAAPAPSGNPLGNAGQADYLNGGEGDQSGNNQGGNGAGDGAADLGGDGGEGSGGDLGAGDAAGGAGDGDNKGLGGDGLLDEASSEGSDNPAPADTEFTFDLPEGFTLDESVQSDIVKLAKEHNVTPEAAKMFVQKHAELKQAELATARQTIQEWKEATAADPEIGGEYLQQTMKNVKNALNAPGGAEVTEILKQTGLQNHPAFIKFLNSYGKMNRNDSNRGGSPSTVVSDQQKIEAFYGSKSK